MLPLRATGEGPSESLPASGDGGRPCCSLAHRRNYSSLCFHCHVAFSLCHPFLHPNFLLFIRTLSLDLGPSPPIQLDHILTCLHQQRPSFQIKSHSQALGARTSASSGGRHNSTHNATQTHEIVPKISGVMKVLRFYLSFYSILTSSLKSERWKRSDGKTKTWRGRGASGFSLQS